MKCYQKMPTRFVTLGIGTDSPVLCIVALYACKMSGSTWVRF
jgi:hypothetical protein